MANEGIFISYRRDDARHAAGRLADDLGDLVKPGVLFRDIEGIDPGVDFEQALQKALDSCAVMLVVIGPHWLDITDAAGERRLMQPGDWIRREIASSLGRGIRTIPVLLEDTPQPSADALPDDMKALVSRQWFEMSDKRWRSDLHSLAEALRRVPELEGSWREAPGPAPPHGADAERPSTASAAPSPAPAPAPAGPSPRQAVAPAPVKTPGMAAFLKKYGWAMLLVIVVLAAIDEWGLPGDEEVPPPAAGDLNEMSAAPAGAPNLAGVWRSAEAGVAYQIQQNGSQYYIQIGYNGQLIGDGRGYWDGSTLHTEGQYHDNGRLIRAVCQLHPAPDYNRFAGQCQGDNGTEPVQMFR